MAGNLSKSHIVQMHLKNVYLYENGDYIPFTLAQKIYLGKSLAEIADMRRTKKAESANWKRQELQAQIDLMNDIMQIADNADAASATRAKSARRYSADARLRERRSICP